MENINNTELPPTQTTTEPQLPPVSPQPIDTPFITPPIQEPINQNEKKTGIGFYIISIIVILFLISACYILAFRSKDVFNLITKKNTDNPVPPISQQIIPTNTVSQQTTPTNAVVKSLKGLSPKETYLTIKAEEEKLVTFDDFLVFSRKYTSKAVLAEFEKSLKEDLSSPTSMESLKELTEAYLKYELVKTKDITNIKETINGDKATLNVLTNKPKDKGTVTFILEEGIWKLEKESWEHELITNTNNKI